MHDNTNRGALFHNKHKKKDSHPDLRGKINIGGKDYDIAAWRRKSKAGLDYLSLSVSEPWRPDAKPGDDDESADFF